MFAIARLSEGTLGMTGDNRIGSELIPHAMFDMQNEVVNCDGSDKSDCVIIKNETMTLIVLS